MPRALKVVLVAVALAYACGGGGASRLDGSTDGAGDSGQTPPDAGVDGGADGALPRLRCDWPKPTFAPGGRKPSLPATPGVLKWSRVLTEGGPAGTGQAEVVGFGEELAVATGNMIVVVSRVDGMTRWKKVLATLPFVDPQGPTFDGAGGLLVAHGSGVIALSTGGLAKWSLPFGGPATAGDILVKEEMAVFALYVRGEGRMEAVAVGKGSISGEFPLAGETHDGSYFGVGGVVVLDDMITRTVWGMPSAELWGEVPPPSEGSYYVTLPTSHGFVGKHVLSGDEHRLLVFDQCGNVTWAGWPKQLRDPRLIGFDDEIIVNVIVTEFEATGKKRDGVASGIAIHRADGSVKIESVDQAGTLLALGADGTIYAWLCKGDIGNPKDCKLRALDENLNAMWTLPLGDATLGDSQLGHVQVVLDEDGTLYLPRLTKDGIELLAVQTASPGLAPTAWPNKRRDNLGRAWLE